MDNQIIEVDNDTLMGNEYPEDPSVLESQREKLINQIDNFGNVASNEYIVRPDAAYRHGYLRRDDGRNMLDARDDVAAIQAWLHEYVVGKFSPHTINSARLESERFMLWAAIKRNKAISEITREDVNAYRQFLLNPQPFERWCGTRRPRRHPEWRPFEGPLTESSIDQALRVIKTMYGYLTDTCYLAANPTSSIRRRRESETEHDVTRMVDSVMWNEIVDTIERMPEGDAKEQYYKARTRFVFKFMYLLAPRLSDLPNHYMDDIVYLPNGDGTHGWWWRAMGKGRKRVKLPLNDDAMRALADWRKARDMTPYPGAYEHVPLIPKQNNAAAGIGRNMLYRIVKQTMRKAAGTLQSSEPERAHKLHRATPHWIRHTALSRMAEELPASVVRDLGRHADLKTSSRYIHTGNADLYRAAQEHRLVW